MKPVIEKLVKRSRLAYLKKLSRDCLASLLVNLKEIPHSLDMQVMSHLVALIAHIQSPSL